MNIFTEKHQELLKSLLSCDVKFLLVGGYAVIYHGYKRTTGDMDLWLEPSDDNKKKLLKVLEAFDFNQEGIAHIAQLDFSKHNVFHFWEEPERVDCHTHLSNLVFSEAYQHKIVAEFEGMSIPVINYLDLILSKIMSERLKDKADIEELHKINLRKNSDE